LFSAKPSRDSTMRGLTWLAVVVGCFVLNHPYAGIVHDNVLYLAQALLRLNPEIYRGDAFFQWGSQDQYTLFSPVYAWLIRHLGVEVATIFLLVLAQILFLVASFTAVRTLLPAELRGFAMLFIVCSVGLYGGLFLFRMSEPFVTPRAYVEAATLFAIALLINKRVAFAFAVVLAAAFIHPLMALAGLLYLWIYQLLDDRRWAWLAGVGIIPIALGLADVSPFTQLFQTFDEQWLTILIDDNRNVFVTQWSHFDLAMLAFDLSVLFIASKVANGILRRACMAAFATALASLGIAFVSADLLQNVFMTSVQPWRALWIAHWMAAVALAFVASRLWREVGASRLIAGLLVFAFVTRGLSTSLAAAVVALVLFHYRERVAVNARIVSLALGAMAAGAFVNWLAIAVRAQQYAPLDSVNPIMDFVIRALSKPLPLLVFATAIVWLGLRQKNRIYGAATIAVIFMTVALSLWDQRTPYREYIDSAALGSHPFSKIVAPHQQVLWHGNATAPWVMMQRKSYFSDAQKSAQVFNREMAVELNRRKKAIAPLAFQEDLCRLMNSLNRRNDSCEPTLEILSEICRDAGDLDFIVLETRVSNKWVASWTWPVPVAGVRVRYYLYDCKTVVA
jgi:hypothetical protein